MPTYFVVLDKDHRLPGSDIPFLLGRFVPRPEAPRFEFAPNDPRIYLSAADYAEPTSSRGSEYAEATSKQSFEASIRTLLSIGRDQLDSEKIDIEESTITVRSLAQLSLAFRKMVTNPEVKEQLLNMMGPQGKPIYMITTIKSVDTGQKGKVTQKVDTSSQRKADVTLPVSALAKATGLPIPSNLDPKFKSQSDAITAAGQTVQLVGEQVCAIEYYTVRTRSGEPIELGRNVITERNSFSFGECCSICCFCLRVFFGKCCRVCSFCLPRYRYRTKRLYRRQIIVRSHTFPPIASPVPVEMQATVTAAAIASPVPVEMQATVAAGRISFEEAPVEEAPSEYTSSVESTHDREERMEEVIVDDFVLSPSLPADILEQEYMHHLSPVEGPVGPEYYLVPNRNTALAHFTHDV